MGGGDLHSSCIKLGCSAGENGRRVYCDDAHGLKLVKKAQVHIKLLADYRIWLTVASGTIPKACADRVTR